MCFVRINYSLFFLNFCRLLIIHCCYSLFHWHINCVIHYSGVFRPNYSLFIFYLYSLFLIHYSASTPEHIFPLPPLISFKRDKNVGNYLVRSAFKSEFQEGTFKCTRTRFKTCPFISNMVKISGPNRPALHASPQMSSIA